MLKIGEFSKLSRISVRMLRHYDEIGLLNPAQTDRFTDYRYYREDQLPVASRITALKEMGFRLAEVRELLALWDDREALERSLSAQRLRLRKEAAEAARKLRLLDTAMERLRKEASMNYNVVIRTLPERYAACVRMKLPRYEDEGLVWKLLCEETDAMRLVPADPCLCSVVFLDEEYQESDVEVEAQKTVQGHYPDTAHVCFRTLPAVTYAGCTFQGGYDQINDVVAAVTAWIRDNGYTPCGPMFDIYHVSPHETKDPAQFVTEVCFPVRKQ